MCKKLINKKTRGFSLVELMVVVAIMGTLASIAIPAYNAYRKSAKKTAYRTDLLSLHKGWLAFGVELDSFCERETSPTNPNFSNVGMASLLSSKLYGVTQSLSNASCATGTLTPSSCDPAPGATTNPCSGCTGGGAFSAAVPARQGPGKANFIGFGAATSACGITVANNQEKMEDTVTADTDCELDVTTYKMGVYGHLSGATWIPIQVQQTGVVDERAEGEQNTTTLNSTCT